MKRGEVYWIAEANPVGGEIKKRRPGIVLTNDEMAARLNRVTVVPTTGNTDKTFSTEAIVTFGGRRSKAMADQITTVSKQRLGDRIGKLSKRDTERIERAVRVYLAL